MQVAQWNLSLQRQIGADWLVSASYLGNAHDPFVVDAATQSCVFLGLGPCTLNGVQYSTCSTTANTGPTPPADAGESAVRTILRLSCRKSTPVVRPAITACCFPFNAAPHAASPSARTTPGPIALPTIQAGASCRQHEQLAAGPIRTTGSFGSRQLQSRRRPIGGIFSICRLWPKRRGFPTRRCALVASGWRFSPILKILSGEAS